MGVPSSQVATVWVQQELESSSWILLEDILFATVRRKLVSFSEEEVWDYIENNLQYVAEHLRDVIAECNVDGAIPTFEIDSEPSPYIRLTAKLPSDVIAKLRRIDPFQLEIICAKLLAVLGATSRETQRTNDGGVRVVLASSARAGRNSPASVRVHATAAADSIPPALLVSSPAHRDSVPDRAPAHSGRNYARAAPRTPVPARSRHTPAVVSLAGASPASMASSRSSCAPSRSPYYPPSGNWLPPARILPRTAAADAHVRSASPPRLASLFLRSAAVRLAGNNFVTVCSALPGSSPAGSAPDDSGGNNLLRPPLRLSRCPALDCKTPPGIPSASGRQSSVPSPPADDRAESSSPRSSGCRSASTGTRHRNSQMPARVLPEKSAAWRDSKPRETLRHSPSSASRSDEPTGARPRSRPGPRTNPPAPRRPSRRLAARTSLAS